MFFEHQHAPQSVYYEIQKLGVAEEQNWLEP